jgi:hypothetical protein
MIIQTPDVCGETGDVKGVGTAFSLNPFPSILTLSPLPLPHPSLFPSLSLSYQFCSDPHLSCSLIFSVTSFLMMVLPGKHLESQIYVSKHPSVLDTKISV